MSRLQKFKRPLKILGVVAAIVAVTKFFPHFVGVVMCTILIGGYYGLIGRCLKFCKVNFLDTLKEDLPGILLAAIIGTGFIALIVSSQHTIYVGDQLETYEPTLYCEETTFTNPAQALKDLWRTINHADYNNFLPMLMALPMHLFGRSFLCYTLYVWIMFALPGIFFAAATFKTLLENSGVKIFSCSALMAIIMLLPALEVPVFVGYANISILLPGAIIFAMLLSLDKEKFQREPLILIGVLCIFAVFQARTAAYMILGEFLGYAVCVAIKSFWERNFLRGLVTLSKKFFVIGISALLIIIVPFFPFVKHMLTYDIATAYSAYQMGMTFPQRILAHAAYLGLLICVIFVVGVIVSLCNKKFLPYAAFFATWFFTAELLICRVQVIDRQHIYTMILPLAFVLIMLIAFALSRKKKFGVALLVILSLNFVQTYLPRLNSYGFLQGKYEIPVRTDTDEIKNFVAELEKLTAGAQVYTFADSVIYNVHTLGKIYIPEVHNALPNLMSVAELDLRDGFPTGFFDAEYILAAEPVQIHLMPQSQQVVAKTSELITTSTPISRHYKLIREDTLHPNMHGVEAVTFKLYKKISPLEKSDIDFVEKIFVELYPNHDDLFKNRFENYKAEHFK